MKKQPLFQNVYRENRTTSALFRGTGAGIFATSPDTTGRSTFWYLTKKEKPEFLDAFDNMPLRSQAARNSIISLFNLYCKQGRITMSNERKEKYFEISNYQDVAIGYVEWEPEGKADKSYFNDYLKISLYDGVTREGSVYFENGKPVCQICGRKAKEYPTIEAAHDAMVEHLTSKIVSDALGI